MKLFQSTLLAVSLVAAATVQGQIRIGGSDLLAPHLEEALSTHAEARGLEMKADFGGSYQAFDKLRSGDLDLGIVAIPVGGELPEDEFRVVPFASLVVTVAVPEGNPINQLDFRQLSGIFAQTPAVSMTRWGDVGLSGEWAARSIAPGAVTPVEHSLALDLFRHTALSRGELRRTLLYFDDMESVRRRLLQDNSAIAVLHRIPAAGDFKVLSIAGTSDGRAIAPTLETVASGEYALRLPLYILYRQDRGTDLGETLLFLMDEEATEAVEKSDLAPLPSPTRERLSLEFERL